MAFTLRPYQDDLINATRAALRRHRRVLLQAPTGAGKTALASEMMQGASRRGSLTLFVCHRAELVLQTSKTLAKVGVDHSFVAANWPYDPTAKVLVCSVDTLKSRQAKLQLDPDLVIWDECHHIGAAGWAKLMEGFQRAYHVGLSATPTRLDGSGLDAYFDELVPGPSVSWLIEQGYLSQYIVYAPSSPDLDKVRSLAGDYRPADAERAMTAQLTGDAIEHWEARALNKRTVGFCVTVAHSKACAAAFTAAGHAAAHLDGDTPKEERAEIIRRFAAGEIKVLFNVNLFGEGFDLSAAAGTDVTIDCVILLRPTQSLSLYLQMVGRCLRPALGKLAVILDHAGCALRHGLPDDVRSWPLTGRGTGANAADTEPVAPAPATCGGCFRQVRRPLLSIYCPDCNHPLVEPKPLPKHSKEELRELKRAELEAAKAAKEQAKIDKELARELAKMEKEKAKRDAAVQRKAEEHACDSLEQLVALAKRRGYRYANAWAENVWARWKQRGIVARKRAALHPA